MNLKSAEIALESHIQMSAVNVAASLYKEIIIPALNASDAKDIGRGHIKLPKECMQTTLEVDAKFHRDALDWCWDAFNMLSFGPLVTKKKPRIICVSNLGSISESISSLRRMLLVQSPSNSRFVYGMNKEILWQLLESNQCTSGEDYKTMSVEEQIQIAATMYRNLVTLVVAKHPKTIETQINLSGNSMSLVVWGSFK